MNNDILYTAAQAVRLYAESHPRPLHVNMTQAADMLGCGIFKVRSMLKHGTLSLNKCGLIPITQIDEVVGNSPNFTRSSLETA